MPASIDSIPQELIDSIVGFIIADGESQNDFSELIIKELYQNTLGLQLLSRRFNKAFEITVCSSRAVNVLFAIDWPEPSLALESRMPPSAKIINSHMVFHTRFHADGISLRIFIPFCWSIATFCTSVVYPLDAFIKNCEDVNKVDIVIGWTRVDDIRKLEIGKKAEPLWATVVEQVLRKSGKDYELRVFGLRHCAVK